LALDASLEDGHEDIATRPAEAIVSQLRPGLDPPDTECGRRWIVTSLGLGGILNVR
jgi:hypothetical protein